MKIDLKGKTAVVSGSTSGIGFAIAQGLAESGARVVVNGRDQARLNAALKKLREYVPEAETKGVAADLGVAEGVEEFLAAVPAADILVN